jgi:hypothetical protein
MTKTLKKEYQPGGSKRQFRSMGKLERTEERKNRFNGESVMLTKEEARKHDEIFLHEVQATLEDRELGTGASKHWQHMRDKLSWFMKHNAKAYMVLLD